MARKKVTRKTKRSKTTRRRSTRTKAPPARAGRPARPPTMPYATITTYICVSDAAHAIDWYKKAFGARELTRMPGPGDKIMHAELQIGDSRLMLSDVFPGADTNHPQALGNTTATIHLYLKNIDQVWRKAVAAGATVTMPLENQFWGDRYGKLRDPFGHSWSLAYPARMTESEKRKKQEEVMRQFEQAQHPGMETEQRA